MSFAVARAAVRNPLFGWLVDAAEQVAHPRPDVLPVLMYHRVDDPDRRSDLDTSLISATPEDFDAQMRFLATRYHPISADELLAVRRGEARLPARSVMVTFDDAYRDFADYAWPAMRRYGVKPILFVPTAYPDQADSFWWDRLAYGVWDRRNLELESPLGTLPLRTDAERAFAFRRIVVHLQSLPHDEAMESCSRLLDQLQPLPSGSAVLGWDELRRLASEGVALAAHSHTHAILDRLSPAGIRQEVAESQAILQRELGSALPIFAYPAGRHNDEVVAALDEAGFEIGFTTLRHNNDLRQADWLRLGRIRVGRRSTLPLIRLQLLPWATRLNRIGTSSRRPPVTPAHADLGALAD